MPNELRFKVDAQNILMPDLARLLMAFNAMYVAAALTDSARGPALASHLRSGRTLDLIGDALSSSLDDSKYFSALGSINAWPVGYLHTPRHDASPLRLTEIRSGSIEGVIEDILESVFGRFRTLLSGIVPLGREAPAFAAIGPMASDVELSNAIIVVATINAGSALHSLKATAVAIDERQVRFNPAGA